MAGTFEGIAKPGAICLSEDAYRQVKGRLDLKVSDLGLTQLKNIAEPIRVYSLQVGAQADAKVATPSAPAQLSAASAPRRRSVLALSALAIALLLAAGAAAWHFVGANRSAPIASTPSAEAAHLSIVVLPFTNLSGDPTQDYFADGITENFLVDAVRCAVEVQTAMIERNAGVPPEKRIEFRVGVHLGDVVEESDGDLMGDGVNIAARLHHRPLSPRRLLRRRAQHRLRVQG